MKRFDGSLAVRIGLGLCTIGAAACSSSETSPAASPDATTEIVDTGTGPAPEASLDGFAPDGALDSVPTDTLLSVDGACGGTAVKATARDANVLLVIDKSGSMLQTPTGFSVDKWDAIRTSLRDALNPVKNKLSLGLLMYPYDPSAPIPVDCSGNCCALPTGAAAINVPVGPGLTTLDMIAAAVDATSPGGATPTARALDQALAYFKTGAGKSLVGDRYVLLATDGGPNCNTSLTCGADMCTTNIDGSCAAGTNCCDPSKSLISCLDSDAVVAKLEALKSAGVKTFVVGIPGSEAYKAYLDAFAVAGGVTAPTGTTKYFAVDAAGGVSGLTGVFSLITGELITSCTLVLDSAPPDPNQINVYVDDAVVPQSGSDGWTLDSSSSPPSIVLKGATCDSVKTKGAKSIRVIFGCPTIK
ncbi:MAG: vWA domain-containing protein [Polyangiales bacterium]